MGWVGVSVGAWFGMALVQFCLVGLEWLWVGLVRVGLVGVSFG